MKEIITLADAHTLVRENWEEGIDCPCCGQFVKKYKIKFNSNMAIFLISLVLLYEKEQRPIHFKECQFGSRNYPYVAKWNLAQTEKSEDSKKRTSGFWIPTQSGIDFVHDRCSVAAYKFMFDNKIFGQADQTISIHQALGSKFNYFELMNS